MRYIQFVSICNAWHYTMMEIGSIRRQALRKFAETGKPKALMEADRLMRMLAYIVAAEGIYELAVPPNFGFHALTGDRDGYHAVTVTQNWRLPFTLIDDTTIADLDLEDYH